MRILVDLPQSTLDRLTAISARRKVPRAVVLREAVDRFLKAENAVETTQAFGAWRSAEDGLTLQRRLRDEW